MLTNIGLVVTILAAVFTMFTYFTNSIEAKIEGKLKDPVFLRQIVSRIRLPFIIFDENESILVDTGAMKYIDAIEVIRDKDNDIRDIKISPKTFMALTPIIESLNSEIEFLNPERGKKFDLIYKAVWPSILISKDFPEGKKTALSFKLEIIDISNPS